MDEALATEEPPGAPGAGLVSVELVFRQKLPEDRLSASEIDVLGSHVVELMSELLQLTYENNNQE